jgi:hypothetical protein
MCIRLTLLGNGSVKPSSDNKYTRNKITIVEGVVFYAVRVVLKESSLLVLPTNSCLIFKQVVHIENIVLQKE